MGQLVQLNDCFCRIYDVRSVDAQHPSSTSTSRKHRQDPRTASNIHDHFVAKDGPVALDRLTITIGTNLIEPIREDILKEGGFALVGPHRKSRGIEGSCVRPCRAACGIIGLRGMGLTWSASISSCMPRRPYEAKYDESSAASTRFPEGPTGDPSRARPEVGVFAAASTPVLSRSPRPSGALVSSPPTKSPRIPAIWACMARISAIIAFICSDPLSSDPDFALINRPPSAGSWSSSSSSTPAARLYSSGSSSRTGCMYLSSRQGKAWRRDVSQSLTAFATAAASDPGAAMDARMKFTSAMQPYVSRASLRMTCAQQTRIVVEERRPM
eukprot:scaffold186267_cov31-Tisochrysis_lutea.AAC.2